MARPRSLVLAFAGVCALAAGRRVAAEPPSFVLHFALAEELLARGELHAAAVAFEAVAPECPTVEAQARARYNAGVVYRRNHEGEAALGAFERLTHDPRLAREAVTADAYRHIGALHADWCEFGVAAEAFEHLPSDPAALLDAAVSRDRTADPLAADRYERFASASGHPEGADQTKARVRAGVLRLAAGDERRANADFTAATRAPRGAADPAATAALVQLAEGAARHRQPAQARAYYLAAIARGGDLPEAHGDVMHARFALADEGWAAMAAIRPTSADARGLRILERKLRLGDALAGAYEAVADDHAHPTIWTWAAAFRRAELFAAIIDAVTAIPNPHPELEPIYRGQIEDLGASFRSRALELLTRIIDVARAARVTNDWVERAYALRTHLDPVTFPPALRPPKLHPTFSVRLGAAAR